MSLGQCPPQAHPRTCTPHPRCATGAIYLSARGVHVSFVTRTPYMCRYGSAQRQCLSTPSQTSTLPNLLQGPPPRSAQALRTHSALPALQRCYVGFVLLLRRSRSVATSVSFALCTLPPTHFKLQHQQVPHLCSRSSSPGLSSHQSLVKSLLAQVHSCPRVLSSLNAVKFSHRAFQYSLSS
ncbi:hypothetical protein B0H17DRAFT_600027 [Mycena rosella]|uniref:Uncharacterized protein n=1 Tax=Mycena rosella TaxID=1033263 RepID=A0AAD7DET0_MYCRO|nr:hypothetical protein B0H17DRAFT_600027 [Mycena rosella]